MATGPAKPTVLIVDDDPNIVELVRLYLDHEGFEAIPVTNGAEALAVAEREAIDLVVLDLMLPVVDGWQVCQRIRSLSDPAKADLPILMLTARNEEIDRIVGLEMGADDYLSKPFNPRELVARIRAILRRTSMNGRQPDSTESEALVLQNLTILPKRRTVLVDEEPVPLRLKAFDLLLYLVERPGEVISRERLLEAVWGWSEDYTYQTRTVDVHIALLRKTLAHMLPRIDTVWGMGYKLVAGI
ncbi:MAG: response regulator transcription factor [Anaerolineaceae bacterium]|nr:response regulator transcription factor [Anaerolineaceae bacterium]